MPYLFVGAGQAGCALLDSVFAHHRIAQLATPVAFNSTIRDLQNLSNVSREAWYGVAQGEGLVPGTTAGFEERVTGGFGRDPQAADAAISGQGDRIADALTEQFGEGSPSFAFLFLGLGGGTGCGIAPHIADAIRATSDPSLDIIAVAVLPNTSGSIDRDDDQVTATRQAKNALYGLDRLEAAVDGIVLVDNQRLAYEDAAEGRFHEYNEYVAAAIVDLISGPVLERIDPGKYEDLDAPVVDLQDVVTSLTLAGGGVGYAALGRAVTMTRSLHGYLVPFVGKRPVDGATLSRLAVSKRSVADVDPADATKAIGQVRAPHDYISGDRRIEVSLIRHLLDSYCSEVNIGMTLTERNLASFTTLLTYAREDIGRIAELESLAEGTGSEDEVIA